MPHEQADYIFRLLTLEYRGEAFAPPLFFQVISPVLLVSAFVPALAPFLIGSLLAFAPFPASFTFTVARLLFVSILTFLLTPLTIPLPWWDRIRSDKRPKAKQQCQTTSKNC
jgi:hypothetical protein